MNELERMNYKYNARFDIFWLYLDFCAILTVPAELSAKILLWFFFTVFGSECKSGNGVTSFPASSSTFWGKKMISSQ